jgi:protein-disulfide isomerase
MTKSSSSGGPVRGSVAPDWTGRILSVCAVAVTFLLAVHVLRPAPPPTRRGPPVPQLVENWQTLLGAGERIGSADAKVVVIEFTDLQCPVCRRFAAVLDSALHRYGDTLAVEVLHFPLTTIHPQALPAARAAECARAQGRFAEFLATVYAQQDSLGVKPWRRMAADAGVGDMSRFSACLTDSAEVPRITRGLHLADSLELTGTPTLIINGWRFGGSIGTARLDSVVQALLGGDAPK